MYGASHKWQPSEHAVAIALWQYRQGVVVITQMAVLSGRHSSQHISVYDTQRSVLIGLRIL